MTASREVTLFLVISLMLLIPFVYAETSRESCTCGCITWGEGAPNNLSGYCYPKTIGQYSGLYGTDFIFNYPSNYLNDVVNCQYIFALGEKDFNTYNPYYWTKIFNQGCCNGKLFNINTEKCCPNMYIPYGQTTPKSPPDNSGLICGKYETCVDKNKDGKSDTCLDEQIPKCPSSEELSCKICDSNTGEVSNVPEGTSSGECSGQDLNNECNELSCDGFGSCISNYSENLCTPYLSVSLNAEVNGFLVDDFNKLKDKLNEIDYSQIFPPNLVCNASVGNYKVNGDFILSREIVNLRFDFINSGEGRIIYSQNLDCEGNCGLDLPEEKAREINPDDIISCEIKKDSETKSSQIKMPDFYLFIKDIKAFNVIEDVSLVAGKPFVARVWGFFNSTVITDMDKDVEVELSDGTGYIRRELFKPLRIPDNHENLNEYLEFIKSKMSSDVVSGKIANQKDKQVLKKVKVAEESANFFDIPVFQSAGFMSLSAVIDPDSKIAEKKDDNSVSGNFEVIKARKIKILPIAVIAIDSDKNIKSPWYGKKFYYPKDESAYQINYLIEKAKADAKEIVENQTQFLKRVYPLSENDIEIQEPKFIFFTFDSRTDIDSENKKNSYNKINDKILYSLEKLSKELAKEKRGVDIVVGVASPYVMFENIGRTLSTLKHAVLIGSVPSVNTLSHEVGHLNGMGETYTVGAGQGDGIPSSNGWQFEQKTGKSLGPRVNIWNSARPDGSYISTYDLLQNPRYFSQTNPFSDKDGEMPIGSESKAFLYLDLTSRGEVNEPCSSHVTKKQYEILLKNYREK